MRIAQSSDLRPALFEAMKLPSRVPSVAGMNSQANSVGASFRCTVRRTGAARMNRKNPWKLAASAPPRRQKLPEVKNPK